MCGPNTRDLVIAASRAAQAYRRVESESRSPLELVVMLYDGALRFLGEASRRRGARRPAGAGPRHLPRAGHRRRAAEHARRREGRRRRRPARRSLHLHHVASDRRRAQEGRHGDRRSAEAADADSRRVEPDWRRSRDAGTPSTLHDARTAAATRRAIPRRPRRRADAAASPAGPRHRAAAREPDRLGHRHSHHR